MTLEKQVNRDIIENVLRKCLKDRIALTKKQVKESFKNFKILAIKHNNKIVGCFLVKENEIHVAILPECRKKWFSRKLFKEGIAELIKQYGYVKTTMMPDNKEGLLFITKLGFIRKGDWYVYTQNKFFS